MQHASSRRLYEYWNEVRGERPAPDRADIDPVHIRYALGDTFILAADFVDRLRFRLAGTRVCALFGRELKGEAFSTLWGETSSEALDRFMIALIDEAASGVAEVTGRTEDGASIAMELLVLPLAHTGHARVRAIGILASHDTPYWLGAKPLAELKLGALRRLDQEADVGVVDFSDPTKVRIRHGFVVYNGGRDQASGGQQAS